jgi:hypothetical protein
MAFDESAPVLEASGRSPKSVFEKGIPEAALV